MKTNETTYLVTDERTLLDELGAYPDSWDRQVILVACESLEEARSYRGNWGDHCAIFKSEEGKEVEFVEVLSVNKRMKTLEDYRQYYEKELKGLGL